MVPPSIPESLLAYTKECVVKLTILRLKRKTKEEEEEAVKRIFLTNKKQKMFVHF